MNWGPTLPIRLNCLKLLALGVQREEGRKGRAGWHFHTCLAKALARSLVVSVLPVPAGPSGAPPRLSFRAPIRVLRGKAKQAKHKTVSQILRYNPGFRLF